MQVVLSYRIGTDFDLTIAATVGAPQRNVRMPRRRVILTLLLLNVETESEP
jgi:hypothetical protein